MRLLATLRESLRVRLLAGTLVWIVASTAGAGWGLGNLFRGHVEIQFQAELRTYLDQLTANLSPDSEGRPALSAALTDPRLSKPYSGLYWQIDRIGGGTVAGKGGLLRSRSLWDSVLQLPADTLADGEVHYHRLPGPEGTVLGVAERVVIPEEGPEQRLRLIVAADERRMMEPVERFNGALWSALALLGLGLVLAAVVQVAVGLAPLRRLHRELGAVLAGRTQKLEGEFPAEIRPLVMEFNAVLGRNAEVVARARTHAGNLAHALKTPLSVLANAAASEKGGELAHVVLDQVEAARRQVDYHLRRARAAAAAGVPGLRTLVAPVAEALVRVMRRVHAGRPVELGIEPIAATLAFRGEAQDLQEMLGNLLDNACKWAAGRVTLSAVEDRGRLTIAVDDDGKGLPADQRDAMIRRGARADEQVPGSGLGLAIVDDLAQLYGGRLELVASPFGGLRAILTLPSA